MTNSAQDAVNRIKETEAKADEAVRKSSDQAQTTVLDAKLDAKEMLYWVEADAQAEARQILEQAKARIEEEIEKIMRNTQREKKELEDKAKKNLPRAQAFIIEEVLKLYGGSKT